MMKLCKCCNLEKDIFNFHKSRKSKDGLYPYCKECNRERNRINHQIRYKKDKELILNRNKEYRLNNLEKEKKRRAAYLSKNKNSIAIKSKEYYDSHISVKLKIVFRGIIKQSFKRNLLRVDFNVDDLLGAPFEEIQKHIEGLWETGMSWDNYGRGANNWQIDHKKPICSFNLHNENERVECFNYLNLIPRWHKDHVAKTVEDRRLCSIKEKKRNYYNNIYIKLLEEELKKYIEIDKIRNEADHQFNKLDINTFIL